MENARAFFSLLLLFITKNNNARSCITIDLDFAGVCATDIAPANIGTTTTTTNCISNPGHRGIGPWKFAQKCYFAVYNWL